MIRVVKLYLSRPIPPIQKRAKCIKCLFVEIVLNTRYTLIWNRLFNGSNYQSEVEND